MDEKAKQYLLIVNDGLYGSERPYNALRTAMNLLKRESVSVRVFFIGDGVLHLLPGQQAQTLPAVQYTRGWGALEGLSDQVELIVDSSSLDRISSWADDLQTEVKILDRAAIGREMAACRAVIHV